MYLFIFNLYPEHPSKRWHHAMCVCDPATAVLIGGDVGDQAHCTDSIWKLEIGVSFLCSSRVGYGGYVFLKFLILSGFKFLPH